MPHDQIRRFTSAVAWMCRFAWLDRSGNTVVEFALVGSLFFILIFGIVEIGRGLWTMNALHYAVQQAARCASTNSTDCGGQSSVRTFAIAVSGILIPANQFTLTQYSDALCTNVAGTNTVVANKVSASYSMQLYVPFVSMRPTLTASSCFPRLKN